MTPSAADLVLEGGVVKGIALHRAILVLTDRRYEFRRIAGTSAWSIVGSLVATGLSKDELISAMREASYGRLADGHPWDDPAVGKIVEIVTEHGVYRGDYLRSWLGGLLADYGVRTFADLPYTDPDRADPGRRRPVVMNVSDVTSGWLRQLPWDYRDCYRLDSSGQAVVNAVRCSMSIPFFFYRSLIMADVDGRQHGMVDGGLLSIFPIGLFDVPEGVTPRWPTFGIKLSTRLSDVQKAVLNHVGSTVSMSQAMLNTLTGCYDPMHLNDPSVVARTIFVDTAGIAATDFDLTPGQPDLLLPMASAQGSDSSTVHRVSLPGTGSGTRRPTAPAPRPRPAKQ